MSSKHLSNVPLKDGQIRAGMAEFHPNHSKIDQFWAKYSAKFVSKFYYSGFGWNLAKIGEIKITVYLSWT
jgi:hypothetical protein